MITLSRMFRQVITCALLVSQTAGTAAAESGLNLRPVDGSAQSGPTRAIIKPPLALLPQILSLLQNKFDPRDYLICVFPGDLVGADGATAAGGGTTPPAAPPVTPPAACTT